MTKPIALITGASSGLGLGFAKMLAARGFALRTLSRRPCPLSGVRHRCVDLRDHEATARAVSELLAEVPSLRLVILNAGVLGRIAPITDLSLDELKSVMEINLWANKTVLDALHAWGRPIQQILLISSGASILGNRGWGGYALSKAALNMLAKLYAHEFPNTHIAAVAPGLVDTPMMDELCTRYDEEAFPALKRLKQAKARGAIPSPEAAAAQVLDLLERIAEQPSGAFVDIRAFTDPEGYRRLYGSRL